MSYARMDLTQSQVFKNACNSIRTSPKYKGFSSLPLSICWQLSGAALTCRPQKTPAVKLPG